MALKLLGWVEKLSSHQRRDKEGVDGQCHHLWLIGLTKKKSTSRPDLSVDKRYWNPVVVKKASASRSELVDLSDDRLESELVADPAFLLGSRHHCSSPHQRHPVLGVLKENTFRQRNDRMTFTWMHFSSRPSMIFLSFSVMIPASSMWPSVGNRFFTWNNEESSPFWLEQES